ncbi:MAG: pre-peptidase C-terminal domain-containing protein [Planctomycetota bacterium]
MPHLTTHALLTALLGLGLASPTFAQQAEPIVETGTLTDTDDKLADESPFDMYTFEASAGDQIVIEMVSTEVDSYLALDSDTMDEVVENDDAEEGNTNSRIEHTATEDGEFTVIATCYDPADRGAYTVTITVTPAAGNVDENDDEVDSDTTDDQDNEAPRIEGTELVLDNSEPRVAAGTISDDDPVREEDDRHYDAYTFVAEAGERVAIDLRSNDVDPYLVVMGPGLDEPEVNDDYNNARNHSRIEFVAPEAGEYTVHATTYDKDDRGDYTLSFGGSTSVSGELTRTDPTLPNGEHIDWYDVTCEEGQLLMLQVDGQGFDTYLILEDPMGSWEENDDHGDTLTSRIESNIFQPGEYRVGVTSYEGGETGSYTLSASTAPGYLATPVAGSGVIEGEFDGSEASLNGNGYVDAYAFEAEVGNTVILTLESDEVDTVLKIKGPGQLVEMNDDYNSDNTNSQMAFRVSEAGTYYVSATTFRSGEKGGYALDINLDANKYDAGEWAVNEGGQVYGVFVGINDYPEGGSDLPYCDADATRTARAFRQHFGMDRDHSVVLTNSDATVDEIKQAIADIGAQAGPDDMFVFFYSGHGDQVARTAGTDIADPDGNDETLSVYDGDISDDEFAQMLDGINAGTTLVVVDACFSGGFAKDIVTKPGRIGIFSSEGDCLSMVAEKYQAGGYLSLFFTDAFNKDKDTADINGDRMLTAHELTFYLQQRFDEIVRSGQRGRTSRLYPSGAIDPGSNLGYQRILSDRDGVSPHIILLDW